MLKIFSPCDKRRKITQGELDVPALPDPVGGAKQPRALPDPDGGLAPTVDQHWDYSQHGDTGGTKRHNSQT